MLPSSARAFRRFRPDMGLAVLFNASQYLAFFGSAVLLGAAFGPAPFGEFSLSLSLAVMGSQVLGMRIELAAQLDPAPDRSEALYGLAQRLVLALGIVVAGLLLVAHLAHVPVPPWAVMGAAAAVPQAWVLVCASRLVRRGRLVAAAVARALPASMTLVLQVAGVLAGSTGLAQWALPAGSAVVALLLWRSVGCARPGGNVGDAVRLWRAQSRFMRNELPALALNLGANHGQVLVAGLVLGDAAAGQMALALRVAMAPTSLLGQVLSDRARSRVLRGVEAGQPVAPLLWRDAGRVAAVSLALHVLLAVGAVFSLPWFWPHDGADVAAACAVLCILGAVRLAVSPYTFVLTLHRRHAFNLLGQALLFSAAVLSVLLGARWGDGLMPVAGAYVLLGGLVYALYLHASHASAAALSARWTPASFSSQPQ